ncbi:PREDICTED: uncharacterized protein LOC109166622 [Ipomoea nil]|uniref:uncharacterized protein LOC109166622 n=1 Tax=Ipomoea nil TaxID=35883 RepID=UPI000901AD73|nr:PREDICTED: uncharacterized protein LOC109166622 [Ipomoea nil]
MENWPPVNINSATHPVGNATRNAARTSAMNPTSNEARNAAGNTASTNRSSSQEVTCDPQSQSNSYYLHINENPALELVSFPLDGSNYHAWARAMTMALSCKNKVAFINGIIKKPPQDDLERYYVWERCNNIVCAWIVRTLSPTIGRSVLWIDTAYGIWDDLKRRFSQQDLFRVAEIMCEIYQTKQGNESLNEYFTKQKLLWDLYLYQ